MENKNININIKDNSDKTSKNINKMNESFYQTKKAYDQVLKSGDSFDKQLKAIDRIVKETPLNVRDMNKQIQAYQSIALSAGRETPIGREALEKASMLRDKYVDIQNETKRLADDHRTLNGVMEFAGIGVAGFGAVQSAMALTGVENENLQKSMQKLMASQMLLNSVNQVAKALEKESATMLLLKDVRTKILASSTYAYATAQGVATKGLKLFRIALISTGVGALIVGLGLLIANFGKVTGFIKKGVKAFDKLGGVMKIVLAPITLLVEGFKLVSKGLQALGIIDSDREKQAKARFEAEQKRHNETIKNAEDEIEAIDKLISKEKSRISTLQALYEVQLKQAKGNAKEIEKIRKKSLDEAKASIDEEQRLFIASQKASLKAQEGRVAKAKSLFAEAKREEVKIDQRVHDKLAEGIKATDKLREQIRTNNFKAIQDFNIRRANLDIDYSDGVEQRLKERADKYKKHLQDRLSAERRIRDLEIKAIQDNQQRELALNDEKLSRALEDLKKNENLKASEKARLKELYEAEALIQQGKINQKYVDLEKKKNADIDAVNEKARQERIAKEDALFELELSLEKDKQLQEITRLTQQYDKKFLLAIDNAQLTKQLEEQQQLDIQAIQDKFRKEKADKEKEDNDKSIALERAKEEAKFSLASNSFSALSELVGSFSATNEQEAKRQFNTQKALNLAGAVTSTAQGITSALATANPVPGGRFIEAGIVGTMGLANISKIASAKFESPNKDVSSTPSTTGASSVQAPNFNIVGDNNINQLAELQQQPTKAYVVSSEVTSAQALDRKVEDFATL